MISLSQVTLLTADDVNPTLAREVLNICQRGIRFGAVKLLTSHEVDGAIKIPPLTSLTDYSVFMLTRAIDYVSTPYCLTVQRDGFILNPDKWNNEWLRLDYVAPIFMQYDHVGSGGFSLRSRNMMGYIADRWDRWDGTHDHANRIQSTMGYYEDGVISFRYSTPRHGFKFATLQQACEFGQGGSRNNDYLRDRPFGFHRTWQKINFNTGEVDSSDTSADLCKNYDKYIEEIK